METTLRLALSQVQTAAGATVNGALGGPSSLRMPRITRSRSKHLNGLRPSHERGGDARSVTDMTRVDQGEGKHADMFTHLGPWWMTGAVLEISKCKPARSVQRAWLR